MIYVRRTKKDTWHFCQNCSRWPKSIHDNNAVVITQIKPRHGELCNECLAKAKAGTCEEEPGEGETT